jgi:hypothetical protein
MFREVVFSLRRARYAGYRDHIEKIMSRVVYATSTILILQDVFDLRTGMKSLRKDKVLANLSSHLVIFQHPLK